jgi:hypothetical protein
LYSRVASCSRAALVLRAIEVLKYQATGGAITITAMQATMNQCDFIHPRTFMSRLPAADR